MVELSIVVPIYNVEKYLKKSVDSIIDQTFKNVEIILVDDGSTDSCGEICDEYEKKDNRIKVIHKVNGGLSSARNAGIKASIGRYIGFIDSDDWINPKMYESMINLATNYDADIVQCDFIKVYNNNVYVKEDNEEKYDILSNLDAMENLYNENVSKTIVTWSKIYKRELFDDILFPEGKIHEDKFTTYKLLYKSNIIIDLHKKYYYYRQTPNSIMNGSYTIKKLDALQASQESIDFYKKNNLNVLYRKALNRYLFEIALNYKKCQKFIKDEELLKGLKKRYNNVFAEYFNADKKVLLRYRFVLFRISSKFDIFKFD